MTTVLADFQTRAQEIEMYFSFLEKIIKENAELYFPNKKRRSTSTIDPELQKVLKAHGFLILYNLVESSIKKSIEKIYEKVTAENIYYKDIRDELKIIWIKINHKNFKDKSAQDIFKAIDKIADDSIAMAFDSTKVIAGNIDARKIREFAGEYGFSIRTHRQAKHGGKLLEVKTKRNDLAHGVESFAECGRQYTLEQMIETKREVIIYIRGILKNVDSYLSSKSYLKPVTTITI
jgi:hypothetical protein